MATEFKKFTFSPLEDTIKEVVEVEEKQPQSLFKFTPLESINGNGNGDEDKEETDVIVATEELQTPEGEVIEQETEEVNIEDIKNEFAGPGDDDGGDDEKKKKFFNYIDANYKGEKESD